MKGQLKKRSHMLLLVSIQSRRRVRKSPIQPFVTNISSSTEIQDLVRQRPSPKPWCLPSTRTQFSSQRSVVPTKKTADTTPKTIHNHTCNLMYLSLETSPKSLLRVTRKHRRVTKTRYEHPGNTLRRSLKYAAKTFPKHAKATNRDTLRIPSRSSAGILQIRCRSLKKDCGYSPEMLRVSLKHATGTSKRGALKTHSGYQNKGKNYKMHSNPISRTLRVPSTPVRYSWSGEEEKFKLMSG